MCRRYKYFFILCPLFFLIRFFPAAAQSQPSLFDKLSIGVKSHYGFLIANQSKAEYVRDSHTSFTELDISTHYTDGRLWEVVNRYPHIGLGIFYGQTGSSRYLGHMAAIFPYVDYSLLGRRRFRVRYRLGLGLGWVEKPYNKATNNKNLMIGSHLNACIAMGLESEWAVTKRLYINGGLSFTHFSNGSMKLPNLGLNMPAVSLGVRYSLYPAPTIEKKEIPLFSKKISYYVYAFGALKETYPLEGPNYVVVTGDFEAVREFAHSGRYGLGLNISHDAAMSVEVPDSPTFEFDRSKSRMQASIYGSYEHVIGNLTIPLQVGVYVFNKYPINAIYQNIGLRYQLSNHLIAALQLKTHLGKADYIQWGLGYKF